MYIYVYISPIGIHLYMLYNLFPDRACLLNNDVKFVYSKMFLKTEPLQYSKNYCVVYCII